MTRLTLLFGIIFSGMGQLQSQTFEWAQRMGGSSAEYCQDMAMDAAGNVFITGFFFGTSDFDPSGVSNSQTSEGNSDAFVAKYDAFGNYVWAISMGSLSVDIGYSISIDNQSNVLVTGSFSDSIDLDPGTGESKIYSVSSSDMFFAKYDNDGNFMWGHRLGGTSLSEYCQAIGADAAGNVYIAGNVGDSVDFDPTINTAYNENVVHTSCLFVAKYDVNGNFLWTLPFETQVTGRIHDLVIDDNNNISITGYTQQAFDFDPSGNTAISSALGTYKGFLARYDSDGNYLWSAVMAGSAGKCEGYNLAVDHNGNVCATGYFDHSSIDFDAGAGTLNLTNVSTLDVFTVKYDNAGVFVWARSVGSGSQDEGHGIAVDNEGDVYVTGTFWGTTDFDPGVGTDEVTSNGVRDIFFMKYAANGDYLWAKGIGGGYDDRGRAIEVDAQKNVYITGYFQSTSDFDPGNGTATLTPAGSYDTYLARFRDGVCSTSASFSSPVTSICQGESLTFTNTSVDATDFVWKEDAVVFETAQDAVHVFTSPGTHTISLIALNGVCTDSAGWVITVNATYDEMDSTLHMCVGDSLLIYGVYRFEAGTYSQNYTSVSSCDSMSSTVLVVNSVDTSLSLSGNLLVANAMAGYQWLDCEASFANLTNQTGQTYSVTGSGSFALEVTQNGCVDTSACYVFDFTGISENPINRAFTSFPNPTKGPLKVELGRVYEHIHITVFDISGKIVAQKSAENKEELELTLDGEKGVYFVKLVTFTGEMRILRIVKN
jgi:hypothetical protein